METDTVVFLFFAFNIKDAKLDVSSCVRFFT